MVSFGFEKVACLVRELNFSPQGYKVIAVIWMSFKCHLLPVVRNVSKCHLSYLSGNKKYHLICQKCVRLQKCQQMIFHARKFLYQLKLHRFMTEKCSMFVVKIVQPCLRITIYIFVFSVQCQCDQLFINPVRW